MKIMFTLFASVLAGCASNLTDYTPVVDPYNTDMSSFEADLIQCRGIAIQVKVEYEEQASNEALTNLAVGVLVGATTGAIVGSGSQYQGRYTAAGAVSGVAAGATASSEYAQLARFGPNRIVDRCMSNRGYELLNDLGAGANY